MIPEDVSKAAAETRRALADRCRANPLAVDPRAAGELIAQCVITEEVCDDVLALAAACEAAVEPLEADALLGWGPAARALDLVLAALARVRAPAPAAKGGAACPG